MDDLLRWRAEFPILERTTYLISNSLGAMPRGVYMTLQQYADTWATRGVRAWEEGWWELAVTAGDKIAPLIGADPGTVSLHVNVTLTQAVIASCFDFAPPRNKVALSDLEFPSVIYFWKAQERRGARVELVSSREDELRIPTERLLAAIDEQTQLVVLSHVLFRSAAIQDVAAVVERAHAAGALIVLDAYQSAGVLPIEAKKWNVDFVAGGTLKWLCGGPGVAYLYVRPELRPRLEPSLTGWLAHPRPFDFEAGAGAYRDDAFRFLQGTPHIPALYAIGPGLDIIQQAGVESIRRRSLALTRRLLDQARERGWRVRTPLVDGERGGTVTLDVAHGPEALRELLARDILCDYRPRAGLRFSPHFYNTEEEVDRAVAALAGILARLPVTA